MALIRNVLKGLFVIIITFIVFIALKNVMGDIGGMPESFKAAYGDSIFIKAGLFYPAVITLFLIIFIHLLLNYCYLFKYIGLVPNKRGIMYGLLFGGLWFLGFIELIVTYHSNYQRHILSGIRDLISLSIFGLMIGILFKNNSIKTVKRHESLFVIIPVAGFFALFHGIQYHLTFKEIEQSANNIFIILWLLMIGAWIGIMYYYLAPSSNKVVFKVCFFSLNVFGINWLLYTSFYNLFLDIPYNDILIRCTFDSFGVLIGVMIYELLRRTRNFA